MILTDAVIFFLLLTVSSSDVSLLSLQLLLPCPLLLPYGGLESRVKNNAKYCDCTLENSRRVLIGITLFNHIGMVQVF